MHSSARLSPSAEPLASETLIADLRVIGTGERRAAAAHFRTAMVACEAVAALLTIVLAVLLGLRFVK